MPALVVSDLEARYGGIVALRRVGIRVDEGEIVSLIGANGAGKTTLLRAISGILRPSMGSITFGGEEITSRRPDRIVRAGIVQVPEGRQIFPKFTVLENLLMGAYHRSDRSDINHEFERMMGLFPRLGERRNQRAGSMSGGEQQMLAIARGLMQQPRCLLLDEPTLGLAPIIVEEIVATIRQLGKSGMTVLIAEQNAAVALAVADHAYVIESGSVTHQGPARELAANEVVRKNYLGV